MNNLPDLSILDSLSPEEKALAMEILKEYSQEGQSSILEELKYQDYDEIPVSIDEFIWNDRYLGRGLCMTDPYTGEKRSTVFPYWIDTLKKIFPDNLTTKYNTLILSGAIGLGKAQPLDAKVLTADGYRTMGSLKVGEDVYGPDGELHKILGVYPQGTKKVCKVTFSDGTSTECCDEHLWTVFDIERQKTLTLETKELIPNLKRKLKHNSNRYKIPMTAPINFESQEVLINPYLLGILIGDGSLTTSSLTFASADEEIVNEVKNALLDGFEVRALKNKFAYSICKIKKDTKYDPVRKTQIPTPNEYVSYIKELNLNTKSENKHIPKQYLYNSVPARIALLQGLMDTDGHISKDGALIEFTTISEQLRDDFVMLVQSLGGTCHIRTKLPSYVSKKTGERIYGKRSYNIGIKLPKNVCPFRLTRKKDRINPKALDPFRYITNIEYIEDKECQCIYIDGEEHLYLTNDFIVTHNTLVAVVAQLYLLYRMMCLKDPYSFYGLQSIDKITFSMLNVTIEAAQGVGWSKAQELIQSSDWFMEHGNMNASRTNPQWQPPKGIELIFGSSNRHVVGRALFSNISDEVNFGIGNNVEKQKAKLKKMISQIDARMISRFGKGTYLPTMNIIISSKDSEQSFLESYIEMKRQNESKTTLIVDEPQWVVRNDKGSPNDPGSFYVAVGNKFLAHELLPVNATAEEVNAYREKGYFMLKVPPIYREAFEDNIDLALTDNAGISTSSSTKYISGVRLNQIKTDTYKNPFTKDIIEVGNSPDDILQYSNFFDLSRVTPRDMSRPLFIHLDMSLSGDKTGIAGIWITGKRPQQAGTNDPSKELEFKVAFSVSVKAPKGFQVSFEKNRNFIRWLRDRGFAIKGVSSDTYQSAQIQQQLKADNFNTKILSVDRVDSSTKQCLPYAFFKSAIYERHLQLYKDCELLTNEIVSLERLSDGHIDHPQNFSKDQADAVCGALYLASEFAEEYSYDYGENLESSLEINSATDDFKKQQMILEFQDELTKIYMDMAVATAAVDHQKKKEYETYQDIMNGIIIL